LDKTLPPLRKTLTASDEGPLFQVFPNPLVERTQVSLVLPNEESLQLFLLNNAGQIIQTIIPNEVLRQGYHQLTLNTSGLKSGFYWLQLATEKKVYTKKMVVIN